MDETMKSESDISDFLGIVCDFYNSYREVLGYSHDDAKHKIILMYSDFHLWLYGDK